MKRQKLNGISTFDIVNGLLVVLITFIIAYPLYFTVIASFSNPRRVMAGETLLWIKEFTVENYQYILKEDQLWMGYRNTILYTLLGTLYNLVMTIPAAYDLTKTYLPLRNLFSWFFFLTMYISGGLIPTYLLMKNLGLIDNPLILIIGSGVSCYNLIVTRQYFSNSIPGELYEAAMIDGGSEWKCFAKIALPLAKPIIAVMALYYGVGHWNSYYTALIYIREREYYPLQLILREILITNQAGMFEDHMDMEMMEQLIHKLEIVQGMKYAIIFVACAPLLIAYPFLQKYFAKGVMIGAVKG